MGAEAIPQTASWPNPRRAVAMTDEGGERPSFASVYENNVRYLWRAARALGVPEEAVDDVLQDVFVVVHAKLPEFEPRASRASIRTWLMSILVRVEANHRRRRAHRTHASLPEALTAPERVDPARIYHAKERGQLLQDLLSSLDEEKRVVFVMSVIQEMTAGQIAEVLGIPANTVSTRLRRARMQFERALSHHRARERRTG